MISKIDPTLSDVPDDGHPLICLRVIMYIKLSCVETIMSTNAPGNFGARYDDALHLGRFL
jgi:hypothetical protein